MKTRFDGWLSAQGGFGGTNDKSLNVSYARRRRLSVEEIDALYTQSAIAARICDQLVNDALRPNWKFKNVQTSRGEIDPVALRARVDKLGGLKRSFNDVVGRGARWGRRYGGSVILIPTLDDAPPNQPISNPRAVFPLSVVPAQRVQPLRTDVAFGSPTFGEVLSYQVSGLSSSAIEVHHSRLAVFEPIELPIETLMTQALSQGGLGLQAIGWGPSVLERVYESLKQYGASRQYATSMMFVSSLLFLQLKNYRENISHDEGEEEINEFLAKLYRQMSGQGLLAMDVEDSIGSVSLQASNVHDLLDRTANSLAADGDMPKEIMLNESPAGLNAGELSGPQEIWFAKVDAWRKGELESGMRTILDVAFRAWDLDVVEYEIEWGDLWTKSERSSAEVYKLNAEADSLNYTIGALSVEQIRTSRFVRGESGAPKLEAEAEAEPFDLAAAPPPDAPAPVASEGPKAQDEALNGAQITSLVDIVAQVVAGAIPRDAAVQIVLAAFPSFSAARAELLLGSAGQVTATQQAELDEAEPPPTDLLNVREAATRFGVPTRAITRAIERGELRPWGLGAHRMVSLADVTKLAKGNELDDEPESLAPNAE